MVTSPASTNVGGKFNNIISNAERDLGQVIIEHFQTLSDQRETEEIGKTAYNTCYPQAVTHPSTEQAQLCLISISNLVKIKKCSDRNGYADYAHPQWKKKAICYSACKINFLLFKNQNILLKRVCLSIRFELHYYYSC